MRAQFERLMGQVYRHRQAVALAVYSTIAYVAYTLAFFLRFEFFPPTAMLHVYKVTLPVLLVVRIICNASFRISTSRWRFTGPTELVRLACATVVGTVVLAIASRGLHWLPIIPRSVLVLECVLTSYLTAGVWLAYRIVLERARSLRLQRRNAVRVLIVGAGEAGSLLAREMVRAGTKYRPVGFLDDDLTKVHTTVHGLTVLGTTDYLPRLCHSKHIEEIVIAIPSAVPKELRRIVELCESTNLRFKVLPGIADVIEGEVRVNQLRDLSIEDLLGREPIKLELPELYGDLRGRSVLITGAAGSIGSELARQVALHEPGILVLLDQSETALFYLERELRDAHPDRQMVFLIGDVVDPVAVDRLFHDYSPSRVFHAAAYKHVPLMQINAREAVRNNVLGTQLVADAAGRAGAEKFVLVSTDKAVMPTSVMGATKRLAEIAVLEQQSRYPATMFAAVRFGNVLGSSGSVIPIFREQIETGKPLTVTHPEVTRYFMTIPEAVHLILQASLLPEMHGRIAMLEMGEPIRILDLAKNLLRISGLPANNGRLMFTGLRWGEKLHEELTAPDETTAPTPIAKVRLVQPSAMVKVNLPALLGDWEIAFAEGRDAAVISALASLFPDLHFRARRTVPEVPQVAVG